ncbi:Uncharacterized protein FWK35_00000777 [Aphis craccivora]|uniref:Uncharacterized protein n=1 Tax=Aphis craccivora TaxID=307492 RepID=A0A6G0ZLL4_APHCR|nr:Uncharacterized protein FWK35_00000777 [Aphis craccivora]
MKIWFNIAISAVFAIVVVVSLASAKSVLQKPIAHNQSRPDQLSVKQSSDIHSTKPCNDKVKKSTTVDTIMAMYPSNNITSNNISVTTSVEDTNKAQATKIASVKTIAEDKIILKLENNKTIYVSPTNEPNTIYIASPKSIIRLREFTCPDGQTKNTNGDCEPIFLD